MKMTSKNILLNKSLNKFVSSHPEVEDIILFGSVVRGKEKPKDVDILIIFSEEVDKEKEFAIKKILEKQFQNLSIVSKTRKNITDPAFDARESILFEGFSLVTGKNLASEFGFVSFGMFKYCFGAWNKLQKTKFYYALNGRRGKVGISSQLGCIKMSDNIVLVPLHNIEPFREFLDSCKIEYKYIPQLIPERLGRRKILESS